MFTRRIGQVPGASGRRDFLTQVAAGLGGLALGLPQRCAAAASDAVPKVVPKSGCCDPTAKDQDDLCIWVHPTEPAQSTIVAADKAANRLFVYDLAGKTLQSLALPRPGNIDVRYGFPLGKGKLDIVACGQPNHHRISVYQGAPETRKLERVDNGSITAEHSEGGCLY